MSDQPRVALAHDYLTQRGGAERVVLAMTRAFPDAPLHTLLYEPDETFAEFRDVDVRPSWLSRVGPLRRHHRAALPLLPLAASSQVIDADVVVVSSSAFAHGMRTTGRKIVYCYSPARFLYQSERYLGDRPSAIKARALRTLRPALTAWDRRAAATATTYLAISTAVQQRIRDTYGIESEVVPAPVTLGRAEPVELVNEQVRNRLLERPFHLVVSRLLPYKNVDAVVSAFAGCPDRSLVVVGTGPELPRLRALAGDNVTFLADLSDGEMQWLYAEATALVAASHEDYGLTPLEAAQHGTPSVVLRWGGFLDTMVEGRTAVFFSEPTPDGINEAVAQSDTISWDREVIRQNVERFSEERFGSGLRAAVNEALSRI